MKNLITLFTIILLSISSYAQTEWKIDPYHSSINFDISHSGISIVSGNFLEFDGNLTTDGEALKGAKVNFIVEVKSINTNVEDRDNHLRSADFFDVDKFPKMTFTSTKLTATDGTNKYLLQGKLTIKGVTKDVTFDVNYGGKAKNDKGEKLGVEATTTINRLDFNIDYDPTAVVIGKDVSIVVHLQFAKK